MRNFKVILIIGLGFIFIFLLVMFLNRGGPASAKQSKLQAEFSTIFNIQKMNYAVHGYYINNIDELITSSSVSVSYYSFFLTPEEYLLSSDAELSEFPQKFRNMAFVKLNTFNIVAIGNIDSDDFFDVWILDQENNLSHVFDDEKDIELQQ